jgi:hypothetical protein
MAPRDEQLGGVPRGGDQPQDRHSLAVRTQGSRPGGRSPARPRPGTVDLLGKKHRGGFELNRAARKDPPVVFSMLFTLPVRQSRRVLDLLHHVDELLDTACTFGIHTPAVPMAPSSALTPNRRQGVPAAARTFVRKAVVTSPDSNGLSGTPGIPCRTEPWPAGSIPSAQPPRTATRHQGVFSCERPHSPHTSSPSRSPPS